MDAYQLVTIISAVGGLELFQWLHLRRITKRQAAVEVDKTQFSLAQEVVDFYKDENARLRDVVNKQQCELDDKTKRLRDTQDTLLESERSINRLNADLITATKHIGCLKLDKAYLIDWHCRKAECPDRRPPNKKLAGMTFDSSHIK